MRFAWVIKIYCVESKHDIVKIIRGPRHIIIIEKNDTSKINVIIRGHFSSLAVNQFPLGNSESEGGVQKKFITFAPHPN